MLEGNGEQAQAELNDAATLAHLLGLQPEELAARARLAAMAQPVPRLAVVKRMNDAWSEGVARTVA
jgi:hypothetical protein